ncbi:hypothetical protein GPECTOR_37g242 [Gonium pectorale]|uniref:Uncharacterized protein n=1 Tax=Gonium pectorale TaxID=33097 RepID=A0A150GBL0_GONPE|nr:hypothetical protein GPECTOR_37g242 [Gonium pectorale]|eukprot:KXZ47236.1 hypothetical protein GPECTOR_37g242 [Gonium pectorale]
MAEGLDNPHLAHGTYAKVLRRAAKEPQWLLKQCIAASNNNRTAGRYAGNTSAIAAACHLGPFTGAATASLRTRMLAALDSLRAEAAAAAAAEAAADAGGGAERPAGRPHPRGIEVVDAYALTERQCWASAKGDGRHYSYIVPMVVTELLAILKRTLA